jgi:hypothetical protein
MEANPYAVLEGSLIAATVTGAQTVIIATKSTFTAAIERLRNAIAEVWTSASDDSGMTPVERFIDHRAAEHDLHGTT